MIAVLENVKDGEQLSSCDEELHLDGEEIGQGDEFADSGIAPEQRKFEPGDDLVNLYFAEVGRTALLSDEETAVLSRQIEDGRHLDQLEKEWVAEHGVPPLATEILSALLERIRGAHALLEALHQYLELPSQGSISEKVSHADLRRAIDDRIDPDLSGALANITGVSQ